MPRRNLRTMLDSPPVFPARVLAEGIDTRLNLIESVLITLRAGLKSYSVLHPGMVPAERPALADIDLRGPNSSMGFERTAVTHALGGFALSKLTKGGFVNYHVALTVPIDGSPPRFRRDEFDHDSQHLPNPPICLTGIEEISGNPNAVIEVLSFERDIVNGSMTNWVDIRAASFNR